VEFLPPAVHSAIPEFGRVEAGLERKERISPGFALSNSAAGFKCSPT